METAHKVLTYYCTHLQDLPPGKQFHFANRLALWNGNPAAQKALAACRSWYVPEPVTDETLAAGFERTAGEAVKHLPHVVAYELRQPYFAKYPTLAGIEAELFRLRHLRTLYGIDASEALLKRHPIDHMRELERALLTDHAAMRALATWAVNFLYLLHRVVLQEDSGISVDALHKLGDGYDTTEDEQLRLLTYFYTHCVIAESNFYARKLPEHSLPAYRRMLARLESLLANRLPDASLDTKLEFLVCCRLAGYKTPLKKFIFEECAHSLSPKGTFLIDTHNTFAASRTKQTLAESEHRNVLFIMSALPRDGHPAA